MKTQTIFNSMNPKSTTKNPLLKRARKKYLSANLALSLIKNCKGSPLVKSYRNSFYCNDILRSNEKGKIVGTYCKNRWCQVCNSNRMGQLINGYGEQLNALKDLYFVTLTAPTIFGKDLKSRVVEMNRQWRKIKNNASAQKKQIKGLRKLEVTVRPLTRFHPHYHLLVGGLENAEWIKNQWLRLNPTAKESAQDIRPADQNSLKEMFKYFTKLTVKEGMSDKGGSLFAAKDRQGNRVMIHPKDLDLIFRSIKGARVFQPFGNLRIISEEVDEKETIERPKGIYGEIFTWVTKDWISDLGEFLTGHEPTDGMKYAHKNQGL